MTVPPANLADLAALAAEEPFVRALARSLIFDDDAVDDVVQQTWLEALRHGLPDEPARRGWLARVVRSRASNARRTWRRRDARERAAARSEAVASPIDLLERQEQRSMVVAAVAGLPEPYRTAIMLRYFEGLAPQSIAGTLGLPLDTVQTRLKRARALLRERLDRAHGGDRRQWQLGLVPIAAARLPGPGSVLLRLIPILAIPAVKPLSLLLFAALAALLLYEAGAPPSSSPAIDTVAAAPTTAAPDSSPAADPAALLEVDRNRIEVPGPVLADDDGLDASQRAGLRGRLLDTAGIPAAGRACRLLCADPVRSQAGGFAPGSVPDGTLVTAHEAICDHDGVFCFERVPAGQSHVLWLGHDGPDATLHVLPFALPAGRTSDLGTLVLERRGALSGRVIDGDGEPVAGARVRAIDLPGALFQLAPLDRLDAGGALLVAVPGPEPFMTRDDGARAWAAAVHQVLSAALPTADAGSQFVVLPYPDWLDRTLLALPIPHAITDTAGRFRVEGLVDGEHALLVDAASGARLVRARVAMRSAEHRDLGDLQLPDGEPIRCRVVDAAGAPVQGAEVRVALQPALGLTGLLFAEPARTADASGAVTFEHQPRGRYVVAVRRDPRSPWHTRAAVEAGDDVDLRLPADIAVHVQVRGDGEHPLAGATFTIHPGPWLGEASVAGLHEAILVGVEAVAAATGTYRLAGLPPGVYTLGVAAPGHAFRQVLLPVTTASAAMPFVVTLMPGIDCTVAVVDELDQPVRGVEVYVDSDGDDGACRQSILASYAGFSSWHRVPRSAQRTDANGIVRIAALPSGRATVLARHRARGTVAATFESLPAHVRIELPRPGAIAGTVRSGGAAVDPSTLRLDIQALLPVLPSGPHGMAIDAAGAFEVDGLAPGRYELTLAPRSSGTESLGALLLAADPSAWPVLAPGSRTFTVEVRSGATTNVALDLDPLAAAADTAPAALHGRVALDGTGLAGIEILVEQVQPSGSDGRRVLAISGADGTWSRAGLQPGRLQLLARLQSPGTVWAKPVAIGPATAATVDFVAATATLIVEVRTAAGTPAAGCSVLASGNPGAGGDLSAQARTDESGLARLRLPVGSYGLLADGRDGLARAPAQLLTADGRRLVVLSEDGLLRGRLDTPTDAQVTAVTLHFADGTKSEFRSQAVTGTTAFTMTGMSPGTWRVELWTRKGQFHAEPAAIEILEHGPTDVVLRLGARKQD